MILHHSLKERDKKEEEYNKTKELQRFAQTISLQVESSSSSFYKLIPNTDSKADSINISWFISGLGYGIRYKKHYGEIRFLTGSVSMDPFTYKELNNGWKTISSTTLSYITIPGTPPMQPFPAIAPSELL